MKNFSIDEKSVSIAPHFKSDQMSLKSRYLTVKMLSNYLHISTSNIYKKIAENSIPHLKIDKRVIFDIEQIDQWLVNGCNTEDEFPTLRSA